MYLGSATFIALGLFTPSLYFWSQGVRIAEAEERWVRGRERAAKAKKEEEEREKSGGYVGEGFARKDYWTSSMAAEQTGVGEAGRGRTSSRCREQHWLRQKQLCRPGRSFASSLRLSVFASPACDSL